MLDQSVRDHLGRQLRAVFDRLAVKRREPSDPPPAKAVDAPAKVEPRERES